MMHNSTTLDQILAALTEQKDHNSLVGMVQPIHLMDEELKGITPLSNYPDINQKTKELILSAKKYIIIQAYNFKPGKKSSEEFLDTMKEVKENAKKAKEKISVYILLNKRKALAAAATGKLFDPGHKDQLEPLLTLNDPHNAYFSIKGCYHQHSGFDSYHAKTIVVDGQVAMIRGCDFGDSDRLETCIVIENQEVAQAIAKSTSLLWQQNSDTPLAPYNTLEYKALEAKTQQPFKEQKSCNALLLVKNSSNILCAPPKSPLKTALIIAVESATESICIMTPNLNDNEILVALSQAAARGVSIQILIGKHHNDGREKHWGGTNLDAMRKLFNLCKEHGGNLDIRWAAYQGEIILEHSRQAMHAKCIIIDKELVFAGSSALDKQGLVNSNETDICISSWEVAANFLDFFHQYYSEGKRYRERSHTTDSTHTSDLELGELPKRKQ